MSDISSIQQESNNSVSTDTEESFLIRQINKSQLFNNSNSNSSSSGASSKKPGRSFFRESFIDENGANKTFSIYQDVINETSDESKDVDLSGLSSLDLKLVSGGAAGDGNVLQDLDDNSRTISRSTSVKNISRSNSIKNNDTKRSRSSVARSNSRRSDTKRRSVNSIHNLLIPPPSNSSINNRSPSESSFPVGFSTKNESSIYGSSINVRIPTPEWAAPDPPKVEHNDNNDNYQNEAYNRESAYRERIYSAYAQDDVIEEPLKYQHQQSYQQPPYQHSQHSQSQLQQNFQFQAPARPHPIQFQQSEFKVPKKKSSQSTFLSSRSASSTRKSILDYELSRKKSPGIHPVMLNNNSSQSSGEEIKIQNVHTVARRGLGFSIVGIVPSIHSARSPNVPGFNLEQEPHPKKEFKEKDIQRIKDQQHKMFRSGAPYNQSDAFGNEKQKHINTLRDSFDSDDSYFDDDIILKRIHQSRAHRINKANKRADTLSWLIFLISFLIPPLFFFLGFGLLDQFIGHISLNIKRISLVVGLLYLVISLACIGIGFGVGLASI